MTKIKATYLGDLHVEAIHLQSGSRIETDAPVDNQGKGELFSPTDMFATSLAACMMTIMGIKARDLDVDLTGSTAEVIKIMNAEPRRIAAIEVAFEMYGTALVKNRTILERAAMTCPVFLSLHPDVEKRIVFNWK